LTASYTFEPLSNLVYTRDQQITTCKGIVMGRLRSQQRQKEVELMHYCFRKLGECWSCGHRHCSRLPLQGRGTLHTFCDSAELKSRLSSQRSSCDSFWRKVQLCTGSGLCQMSGELHPALPAALLAFCCSGLPIAGHIHEPGFLEGGDFFPMGQDLALVGVGLRSNVEACQQLMDRDLLGTRRLGVVRDDFDRHQVRPLRLNMLLAAATCGWVSCLTCSVLQHSA
jgi:hypothetical protein